MIENVGFGSMHIKSFKFADNLLVLLMFSAYDIGVSALPKTKTHFHLSLSLYVYILLIRHNSKYKYSREKEPYNKVVDGVVVNTCGSLMQTHFRMLSWMGATRAVKSHEFEFKMKFFRTNMPSLAINLLLSHENTSTNFRWNFVEDLSLKSRLS